MKVEETRIMEISKPISLDFCSQLKTDNRLFFGGYPSKQNLFDLQRNGVRYIIDCTTVEEKNRLPIYDPKFFNMLYLHYPIIDNFVPTNINNFRGFLNCIRMIIEKMEPHEAIYVHCKGGHGRSGMVLACVLCSLYGLSPYESIREITNAHLERKLLSPKWKSRLCPNNEVQRRFVNNLFPFSQILVSV